MTIDEDSIRERVQMLIQYEGITNAEFAEKMERDASNLSAILGGRRKIPSGFIERITKIYPNINKEWLLFGKGYMFQDAEETYQKMTNEIRPRMPMNVAGCKICEYLNGTKRLLCDERPLVRQFPDYDFTLVLKNNSMSPRYERGDEIALRSASIENIEWGHEYVIDIKTEGPKFKRIYNDGSYFRCSSYDSEKYPDFLVAKNEVCAVYRVVGMIRIS